MVKLLTFRKKRGGQDLPHFDRSPRDCFFILAPPRSGSTWLEQTLDAHPELTCLHEPSNLRTDRTFRWLLSPLSAVGWAAGRRDLRDRLLARLPVRHEYRIERLDEALGRATTRLAGAKIVWPNLVTHVDFTRFFIRYRAARFLLLDRSPLVDVMCSWAVARRTSLWNSESRRHESLVPLAISVAQAEQHLLGHLLHRRLIETYLRALDISFIELSYEQLLGDTTDSLARIAGFLGIGEFRDHSRLHKLMVRPYREVVANYDDLLAVEASVRRQVQE